MVVVIHNQVAETAALHERHMFLDRLSIEIQRRMMREGIGYTKKFCLVFAEGKRGALPDIHWLRTSLMSMPRWLRKSISKIYFVAPSWHTCLVCVMASPRPPLPRLVVDLHRSFARMRSLLHASPLLFHLVTDTDLGRGRGLGSPVPPLR